MSSLQHFGISVVDLDRSVDWYARYFGFEEQRRFEKSEFEMRGAVMKLGAGTLEIIQPLSPTAAPPAPRTVGEALRRVGANHLAINVDNLTECFSRLIAHDVTIVGGLVGNRFFFCTDPDGTPIEVRQA